MSEAFKIVHMFVMLFVAGPIGSFLLWIWEPLGAAWITFVFYWYAWLPIALGFVLGRWWCRKTKEAKP